MPHTVQQLGQLRPANTTAASVFSPGANTEAIVHNIVICNTSGASAKYRLFIDDNGTTYNETTALAWDVTLPADTTDIFEVKLTMNDATGNLAVRTDTNDALTFTVSGEIFT